MPYNYSFQSQNLTEHFDTAFQELLKRSQVLSREYDRRGEYVLDPNDATKKIWKYTEEPEQWMERIRYPRDRIAPFNEDIMNAHAMGRKTGIPRDYFDASRRGIGESHVPFFEEYENYIKPYTKLVIDDLRRDAKEYFDNEILPSIKNQFVSLGQHGSTRQTDAVLQAADKHNKMTYSKSEAAKQAGLEAASRMFNADKERRLHASQAEGELGRMEQASHLTDLDTLMRQGIQDQATTQAAYDLSYQDWLMQQNMPRNLLTQHAAVVHGMPYQGESITASYHPNPQTQSHLNWQGNLGNIAGQMYGAHMQRRARGGHIRKRRSRVGPHLMNIRRK